MKLLNERAEGFQEGIDIFEPISRDEPEGVWSIQKERGGSIAILRSLKWPGYVFYHRPGGNENSWGGAYYGTGQRNDNVGYML
jgi:radial spoke head protein 9